MSGLVGVLGFVELLGALFAALFGAAFGARFATGTDRTAAGKSCGPVAD